MAGLEQIAAPVSPSEDMPSLPLYAAGFVILLCGILGANAALAAPDYGWITDTVLLSGLGFLFSYGSRRLGLTPQALDYGFVAALAILLALFASQRISPMQLLPQGADQPNQRLLSGLVWGGAIWAWALHSDNRVAGTTVPVMAILGMAATIDINTPVLVCFGAFILTVIFLLIHQNYLQNRSRAAVTSMPKLLPPRLLIAQVCQAGVCGLIVLLAGMLIIIPAQAVFSHLSLSEAIRHLASIQTDTGAGGAVQRFSDADNLAIGTGNAWSSSADVVMRVTPSDGQPHYWRGRTYDVYTGDGWQSSLEDKHQGIPLDNAVLADRLSYSLSPGLTPGDLAQSGRPSLTANFEVHGLTTQFYYADSPCQVLFDLHAAQDTSGVEVCADGRLSLADGGDVRFPYQIVSLTPPDISQPGVPERLRQAGTNYPNEVRKYYLAQSRSAQPDDLAFYRQSVAEALRNLPPDRHDPLDEASALRDWVSRRCVYTLTPPPLPEDTDHVHAFLGDTRRGYCDMFASSLAILCRTAGIPARLAVGFAPGDPDGHSFNLRAEDKHAWTEVYFPGTGWVTFDATAGTVTDGTVPGAASGQNTSWLSRLHFGLNGDWKLVYLLVGLILAIAAYVAKTEIYDPWRLRRRLVTPSSLPKQSPRRTLEQGQYARLSRALARLGLPRHVGETPNGYAARILPLLPPLEGKWNVILSSQLVSALTAAYTEAVYSDPALPSPPAAPWDGPLSEFESAVRRVSRGRFWQRVTHPRFKPA